MTPMYLGPAHRRIPRQEYDDFIDKFVAGVKRHFPNAVLLQWEDFSKSMQHQQPGPLPAGAARRSTTTSRTQAPWCWRAS